MAAFISATPLSTTPFLSTTKKSTLSNRPVTLKTSPKALANTSNTSGIFAPGKYSNVVDKFFANDIRRQYMAKGALPDPPLTAVQGSNSDAPHALRAAARENELRYRQLPVAVRLHNMYESRRQALSACTGFSSEEERVLANPMLASAMAVGKAEADRSCIDYIESSGAVEDYLCNAVEKGYVATPKPPGLDDPAAYDGYQRDMRLRTEELRTKQHTTAEKLGAAFAARKVAFSPNQICAYDDDLYSLYPRLAGSMRPGYGYYTPQVSHVGEGPAGSGDVDTSSAAIIGLIVLLIGGGLLYLASHGGVASLSSGAAGM